MPAYAFVDEARKPLKWLQRYAAVPMKLGFVPRRVSWYAWDTS